MMVVATDLCDLDGDGELACHHVSVWFETCYTAQNLLGETLSLNDIVLKDETTQISEDCADDEADPSTRCCKRHR